MDADDDNDASVHNDTPQQPMSENLDNSPPAYVSHTDPPSYLDIAIMPAYYNLASPAIRAAIAHYASAMHSNAGAELPALTPAIIAALTDAAANAAYVYALTDVTAPNAPPSAGHRAGDNNILDALKDIILTAQNTIGVYGVEMIVDVLSATTHAIAGAQPYRGATLVFEELSGQEMQRHWHRFRAGLPSLAPSDKEWLRGLETYRKVLDRPIPAQTQARV
ncbi:hypothetical protein QBC46DRAFT_343814 [Diplogelasinospora grovesii]|uniref:Uncharacterized protein n=1 Tax=Diplogelasinospora grovesii TaxID=303347 RepID=A0AAN6N314_9PEZI|nr:hypothetical protein QBC46DRAFT_343814 [Diplogelasinospora grovesii]